MCYISSSDVQDPKAVVVLTPVKLLVFDLLSSSAKYVLVIVSHMFFDDVLHDALVFLGMDCRPFWQKNRERSEMLTNILAANVMVNARLGMDVSVVKIQITSLNFLSIHLLC